MYLDLEPEMALLCAVGLVDCASMTLVWVLETGVGGQISSQASSQPRVCSADLPAYLGRVFFTDLELLTINDDNEHMFNY